jgi:glycine cleavage system H protein
MPEFLEMAVDKFTFRVATDRLYTAEGLWVAWDPAAGGRRVRVGLTDYLQQHSGDIAFATVKPPGSRLAAGDDVAAIETIKANVSLPSPVGGRVVEVNPVLARDPEVVNRDPYGGGWLATLDAADWETDRVQLLDPPAYLATLRTQVDQELKGP